MKVASYFVAAVALALPCGTVAEDNDDGQHGSLRSNKSGKAYTKAAKSSAPKAQEVVHPKAGKRDPMAKATKGEYLFAKSGKSKTHKVEAEGSEETGETMDSLPNEETAATSAPNMETATTTSPSLPTNQPTTLIPQLVAPAQPEPAIPAVTPNPTPQPITPTPTPLPTTQPTTGPTITHPLNPRWFQTDHEKYVAIEANEYNQDHHSHLMAGLFCVQNDLDLCPYEVYCPNGQGNAPYMGGPPKSSNSDELDENQWAAYITADVSQASSAAGGTWVQVGKMPEVDGGFDENNHGICWTWDEWENWGGVDIEDVWNEDHRVWMLCCERSATSPPEIDETTATTTLSPTDPDTTETNMEEVGDTMEEVVTPPPTDSPREPAPSPSVATSAPTYLPHPRNPQWYQTSHPEYQTLVETHSNSGYHSHLMAGLFCVELDLFLCSYDEYCPNGKSKRPYNGPPKTSNSNSLEAVQWAPIYTADTTVLSSVQGGSWVQIGDMPESDGGDDSNGHGSCWTYDDWENGIDSDIEDSWSEDHRRWILCCEEEDTTGGFSSPP